jgi:hypothetical protein
MEAAFGDLDIDQDGRELMRTREIPRRIEELRPGAHGGV